MTDNTAIAKVLEDEDDEEKKGLVDNEDDINTPSGVLKQMNFIGDKITEVSDHFQRTCKTFFYSVIFRHFKFFIPLMNLINCYIFLGCKLILGTRIPLPWYFLSCFLYHSWFDCRLVGDERSRLTN